MENGLEMEVENPVRGYWLIIQVKDMMAWTKVMTQK